MLIQTGRARGFQADDYLRLFQELRAHARRLVLEEPLPHRVSAPELPGMPARPTPVVPPDPADALERFVRGESWADRPESFDRVVAEVRERLFGQVGLPLEHPAPKPQVLRTTKVTRKRRSPKSKAVGAAT
jgi:hypothetical protein